MSELLKKLAELDQQRAELVSAIEQEMLQPLRELVGTTTGIIHNKDYYQIYKEQKGRVVALFDMSPMSHAPSVCFCRAIFIDLDIDKTHKIKSVVETIIMQIAKNQGFHSLMYPEKYTNQSWWRKSFNTNDKNLKLVNLKNIK